MKYDAASAAMANIDHGKLGVNTRFDGFDWNRAWLLLQLAFAKRAQHVGVVK